MIVRRNIDERLREIQRAAEAGDPDAQVDYYRAAVRAGDCELIGEALFALGPERALQILTPPKRFKGPQRHELRAAANATRDNQAICLGLRLVQLGYLPDIPIKHYSEYSRGFSEHELVTKPKWVPLPASVPGRARRRRFFARYGFHYQSSWGHEEGIDRQTPDFWFQLEPAGKHYQAEEYVRGLGEDEAARRIAPGVRFLARWSRSSALTRPWASGVNQSVAGGGHLANAAYFWAQSDPDRVAGPYEGALSRDEQWVHFLNLSRAGVVPGDEVPPRPPHPGWNEARVLAWLRDPARNDQIRALFYADLWLAGLLVPGSEVAYDPITGGPRVQQNPGPVWRRNMSRLSGPAVEEKGLLKAVEPYWDKIRAVAARSLKKSARGFLPDLRDESKLLGCGAWGCVWKTSDKRFALKVSLDATEGPIIAQIMSKKHLRLNAGCVYYHRIWRLPDLVRTAAYGRAPAYVILREELGPIDWLNDNGDVRRKYAKIHMDLEDLPDAACDLVSRRSDLEYCKTIECADAYTSAERAFLEYVVDLRTTEARHVGTFVAQAFEAGILLGDVHPGNVGLRRHNLRSFGVPSHRQMVVADVGDEGQPVCPEDEHPRIKVMRNPIHPRHPMNMAYWLSQIPVL